MKPGTALDFETLVERYYQPVFTFAVKLCGQLGRALELTQHTFCAALNRETFFGEPQNTQTWLFTLLFCEFLKESRRARASTSSIILPRRARKQAASTPIFAALTKVRKELQAPLILFYAKDLSFSQIADYLGISVEAVLKLLSQGREELSTALASTAAQSAAPPSRGKWHR